MTKPLPTRVERLEQLRGTGGPQPWMAELEQLEAAHAARFPDPIEDWSEELCEAYLADQASDAARHLGELRARLMTPQDRADLAAFTIALESMSIEQLDEYLAAKCAVTEEEPPLWQP